MSMFGLMHSPLPNDQLFSPHQLFDSDVIPIKAASVAIQFICTYLLAAGLMFGLGSMLKDNITPIDSDEAYENLE